MVELLGFDDKIRVGGDLKFSSTKKFLYFEKKEFNNNTLIKHTKFVYDGFKLIAEFDVLNNNALISKYAWAEDNLLTLIKDNASYYYMVDGNKNITALVDENAVKVNSYEYSPFGKLTINNETIEQPFKFSSEYADDETGLIYYNYRYYDVNTGKWTKRDPIGELTKKKQFNLLYGFVTNNPISKYDLLGLNDMWNEYSIDQSLGINHFSPDNRIRFNLTYDFADEGAIDKLMTPFGTIHFRHSKGENYQNMLDDIEKRFRNPKYHKMCHCINYISISAHANQGFVYFDDNESFSYREVNNLGGNPKVKKSKKFLSNYRKRFKKTPAYKVLSTIEKYLCKDKATVRFVQCNAGKGKQGQILKDYLKNYFGPNTTVILYEKKVKWFWGVPSTIYGEYTQ